MSPFFTVFFFFMRASLIAESSWPYPAPVNVTRMDVTAAAPEISELPFVFSSSRNITKVKGQRSIICTAHRKSLRSQTNGDDCSSLCGSDNHHCHPLPLCNHRCLSGRQKEKRGAQYGIILREWFYQTIVDLNCIFNWLRWGSQKEIQHTAITKMDLSTTSL